MRYCINAIKKKRDKKHTMLIGAHEEIIYLCSKIRLFSTKIGVYIDKTNIIIYDRWYQLNLSMFRDDKYEIDFIRNKFIRFSQSENYYRVKNMLLLYEMVDHVLDFDLEVKL